MSEAKFELNVGKKMLPGKFCGANGKPNKLPESNNFKTGLAQFGGAKRLKMSRGANSATNIVSNSNNATKKMKSGGKNASASGLVYPTWDWSPVGLPFWSWSIIALVSAWVCPCLWLALT